MLEAENVVVVELEIAAVLVRNSFRVVAIGRENDLRDRLIRLFGSSDLHRTTLALDDAARRLSRYFLTQLAINAGFGLLIAASSR